MVTLEVHYRAGRVMSLSYPSYDLADVAMRRYVKDSAVSHCVITGGVR